MVFLYYRGLSRQEKIFLLIVEVFLGIEHLLVRTWNIFSGNVSSCLENTHYLKLVVEYDLDMKQIPVMKWGLIVPF